MIRFTIPLLPPSVNHYVTHGGGAHRMTPEARAFKDAVILLGRGQYVTAEAFQVETRVFLGEGDKGDVDNFPKLILDGLDAGGAFRAPGPPAHLSDAHVTDLIVRKRRDPTNPRTEIMVAPAGDNPLVSALRNITDKCRSRGWLVARDEECGVLVREAERVLKEAL